MWYRHCTLLLSVLTAGGVERQQRCWSGGELCEHGFENVNVISVL